MATVPRPVTFGWFAVDSVPVRVVAESVPATVTVVPLSVMIELPIEDDEVNFPIVPVVPLTLPPVASETPFQKRVPEELYSLSEVSGGTSEAMVIGPPSTSEERSPGPPMIPPVQAPLPTGQPTRNAVELVSVRVTVVKAPGRGCATASPAQSTDIIVAARMSHVIDLVGQVFDRLTVVGRDWSRRERANWLCDCICGKRISAFGKELRNGDVRSCGCLKSDVAAVRMRALRTTHGQAAHGRESREWRAWRNAKKRCLRPEYAGRGITMCDRWRDDCELFLTDVLAEIGPCPTGLTLDRRDNDKGYESGNVRWATWREQANNRRSNRMVQYRGETMSISEAVEQSATALPYTLIVQRVQDGWPIDLALTLPPDRSRHLKKRHRYLTPS